MASHVQLTQQDIDKIATVYGLTITHFAYMEGGYGNTSYLLTTNRGKCVLTLSEHFTLNKVQAWGQLMQLLVKQRVRTVQLITTESGELTTICRGRPVLLKQFVVGYVEEDMSSSLLHQIGAETAKLHQIPPPSILPKQHAYGSQIFPSVVQVDIDTAFERWLAEQYEMIRVGIPAGLQTGLIHGDLFYDNILVNGDQLQAIIDFEHACHYYTGFDLGMAIVGSCQTDGLIDMAKARAFIAGYQHHTPLPEQERAMIQLFTQYAAVATAYWRFWAYNIHTPTPANAKRCWLMVQIAEQIAGIEQTEFRKIVGI